MKSRHLSNTSNATPPSSTLTRRQAIQGAAALAAFSLIPACSSSGGSGSGSNPTGSNSQPTPSGSITGASLTVTSTTAGSIGPAFAGFSYEKSQIHAPVFTGTNSNLIALFKRLGTSVLRIGGNSVDQTVWNPSGAGQTSGQVAPSDVAALAAFVKESTSAALQPEQPPPPWPPLKLLMQCSSLARPSSASKSETSVTCSEAHAVAATT